MSSSQHTFHAIDPLRVISYRLLPGQSAEENFRQLIDLFARLTREGLERMREAVERDDMPALRAEAHSLHGAAATIGATALQRTGQRLAASPALHVDPEVRSAVLLLEQEFEEARRELEYLRRPEGV